MVRRRRRKAETRKIKTLKRGKKRVKNIATRKVVKTAVSWVGKIRPFARRKRIVRAKRFCGSKRGRGKEKYKAPQSNKAASIKKKSFFSK